MLNGPIVLEDTKRKTDDTMSAQNPDDDDTVDPVLHHAEGSDQMGPRSPDNNKGTFNADKALMSCSVDQPCPATGTQHGGESTEAQDLTKLLKRKDLLGSLKHTEMLGSKGLNHFEDQQNECDEIPDSHLNIKLNIKQENDLEGWGEEQDDLAEVPDIPLRTTLNIKQETNLEGWVEQNDINEVPDSPLHTTLTIKQETNLKGWVEQNDLDEVPDSPLHTALNIKQETNLEGWGEEQNDLDEVPDSPLHTTLNIKQENDPEDRGEEQNDVDEVPDSPLHTTLNIKQEAHLEGWGEEINRKHPPLQEEIPHRPLHKTLTTKGRKQQVQRDKFVQVQHQRNDLLVQGEVPSCPPHRTDTAIEHRQLTDKDKGLDGVLSHHLQRDIVDGPLLRIPKVRTKATHFQGQGSGMAQDAILQSSLTRRNSKIPSLDKIVNKLRTVNESKEASSLEPDKDSFLLGAAVNANAEASTSSRATKGMLSGGLHSRSTDADNFLKPAPHGHSSHPSCFHSKERVGASISSKQKRLSRKMPHVHVERNEKSVENDLMKKRCLVVENLVVGEAFVASASVGGGLVLERPLPPGQQCALCKEYVPQAGLNSHRCKAGVSGTKQPLRDGESSGKSQNQEPHLCRVCQRPLTEENGDGTKRLVCRECAGQLHKRESVSVLEDVVRGIYQCDRCEQSFGSRSNLSLHLLSHVEVKMHECDECDKTFKTQGRLRIHKRIHAGQPPHQCHICDRTFGKGNTLVCHMRTHSGEKPFQCDLCDKSFTQNSALTVHKRIHSGEQPFSCELCGKNFRDKSNLRRHVRTHSGDQPFECTVCGKRFSTKDHMNTHFRIHTGDRPYQCSLCDKAFTQSSTLVGHMRTHTGELLLRCNVCGKKFSERNSYSTHMELHAKNSK